MKYPRTFRASVAVVGAAALILPLASCSGADGGSDSGTTEISFLLPTSENNTTAIDTLIEAFEAENPDITVKLETQPAGTEGDNLTKTKLATGEMNDVFFYNSGSLFQGLSPDQYLVDLSDESWVADVDPKMIDSVSTDNGIYGAPWGSTQAGGILYSKTIYEELGLEIPASWAEYAANNEKIKAAGKTAVVQTYGDTFSSQLYVLGDFANVLAQDPEWAEDYTAGKKKFADQPALQGFLNLETSFKEGWLNEDFASARFEEAIGWLAMGEAAHYPMQTGAIASLAQNYPDQVNDVGVFPIPAQDAAHTSLTVWLPNAMYIPKTTEGDELVAAKKFLAFLNSPAGCDVQNEHIVPSGPYAISTCELPDDVPAMLKDMQMYVDAGKSNSALEYLSPIKGPNLENILVEVGSGIRSAQDGAALYDEDVKKQAMQLGLEGW
ncbi:ABC transporter substrate-binding protein [Microbacterium sp. zg.Y909]|uniref:ABC transporter substrate-binding protein n=1 Tax=Microbacterium sp. zg.Y909 TaxID=2969413 RepID=UPI00214B9207|nr:ABC transporter substrate-binding protein [Microbacterium sp. zg.Y909]MCR2824369.1 ABC transporter substrate-binding protein [Microbacterium sp. zg.Y909]